MANAPKAITQVPCPEPQVYVVPARPIDSLGWMVLSGLLFLLWVKSAFQHRKLKPKQIAPGIELHEDLEGTREEKAPKVEPRAGAFQEFSSALKGMGFKAGEIKARWAQVDPAAPVEQQVAQAIRLGN